MTKHSTWLAAALAATVAPPLAMAETVKVGVVMTYSGGGAQFAQQIERAMDLYMDQEGKAKLGEHEIELIKRDARNPGGDAAKTAVQELIVREEVDLLTGFVYSPNIIASAPLIDQAKVPTLVLNAATAWIPSLSPYIARISMTMWQTGYPMGGYAVEELGCETAAVGYTDYPPGKDSLEAFRMGFEQAGGDLIDEIPMGGPAEVPDFTPFMQRVKDAAPDCFFVFVPSGNHVAAVFKTYADLGMREAGVRLIGPGDLTQDTELQDMGEEAVGVVTLGQYQADLDVGTNPEFVAAWREAYGEDSTPDFMAAAGYDGMAAIVDAIVQQDGQIDPDRTMEIWAGWTHDGPRGTVTIDPETRDIVQDMKVNEVYAEDGRLRMRTIDVIPQVKDPCKEQKVGRCAE
ncbi:MAG TPA: ABC transporter substrate-binding protein [Geminicoccaceae bacterium]